MTFALLFDLDGTLVDTDRLHHRAFALKMRELGRDLTFAEYRERIMGKPNVEIMAWLFPDQPERRAPFAEAKEAAYRAMLDARIEPVRGARALLDWAAAAGAPVALVTNAPRANVAAVLSAAGLRDRFETVIIGDECVRPKPDPFPYQEAMRRIGATPSRSIAFEDSPSGLRAARNAGATVFGLATALAPDALRAAGTRHVIADFEDPLLWSQLQTLKGRVA